MGLEVIHPLAPDIAAGLALCAVLALAWFWT